MILTHAIIGSIFKNDSLTEVTAHVYVLLSLGEIKCKLKVILVPVKLILLL